MTKYTLIGCAEGVNGLTEGNTAITTISSASGSFSPLSVNFIVTSTDKISEDCIVSIGTNDPDYNNIVNKIALTDKPTVNPNMVLDAGSRIVLKVIDAGTAQSLTFNTCLYGCAEDEDLILKDDADPAHYWRVSVDSLGILTTTDLGTTPP